MMTCLPHPLESLDMHTVEAPPCPIQTGLAMQDMSLHEPTALKVSGMGAVEEGTSGRRRGACAW